MEAMTALLGLPLLVAGQGQKDVTHNEALLLLEAVVAGQVESEDLAVPPPAATPGQCWLVAPGASGLWGGRAQQLAVMSQGGWRFVDLPVGHVVRLKGGERRERTDEGWRTIVPELRDAVVVAAPAGGAVVDAEARASLMALLAGLRSLGVLA
ncbi:DUF2793 domain-containing protein [Sandaracinobacteroides saxicola]|uniref:DUF2793 domain-containing protein n=1 Tax=Sandaracinobacteroides saxicola TaxID=2759707 RepID=A0A7G5IJ53_9SPHN|nr:DUF2793 domain-containing protein [Sandaracinobacteroides saxicola]QMW23395.1 DUF2793 domain-containing protein [Sandaracinobacteroides saxicola]